MRKKTNRGEKMKKAIIPTALIVELDDVGWDNGNDLRVQGYASRSGLPRYHALEDYEVLRDISNKTGKNMALALCLGDWDKDNLLRGEVGITHDPFGWNRAKTIDIKAFEKYRDVLEGAEHLEYIVHANLHGVYDENGKRLHEKEFLKLSGSESGKPVYTVDEADFKRRFEIFLKIYNSWGFKKPLRGFVNPCSIYDDEGLIRKIAKILYSYGIRYWADDFRFFPEPIKMVEGVACFRWAGGEGRFPWNAYDCDPNTLAYHYNEDKPSTCFVGNHWTNFLRFDPKRNKEQISLWVKYYEKQSECFGNVNANTVREAINQLIYHANASLTEEDSSFVIDTVCAINFGYEDLVREMFISISNEISPKECIGAEMTLYEKHGEFSTYKLSGFGEKIVIKY